MSQDLFKIDCIFRVPKQREELLLTTGVTLCRSMPFLTGNAVLLELLSICHGVTRGVGRGMIAPFLIIRSPPPAAF